MEIIKLLVHTMYSIKKLLKDKLIAQDILTQFIAQQHKLRAKTMSLLYRTKNLANNNKYFKKLVFTIAKQKRFGSTIAFFCIYLKMVCLFYILLVL